MRHCLGRARKKREGRQRRQRQAPPVTSCFWPSRQGRFSMSSTRMPPSMCSASRNTRTVSASLTAGWRSTSESRRAAPRLRWPARKQGSAAAESRPAPGPRGDAPGPRSTADCGDGRRCAARVSAGAHNSTTAATALRPRAASRSPKPHISTSSRRPRSPVHSDGNDPHADRPVRGGRQHEQRVEGAPADAAARATQDVGGAEAAAAWRRR